jgi:hypothetical protein
VAAKLSGSLKAEFNRSVAPERKRSMPDFKQPAEGEKPADPERYILIEVIHEPAIGDQYRVTGKGLGSDQPSGDFTDFTLEDVRKRASDLAKAVNVPVIYPSSNIARTET